MDYTALINNQMDILFTMASGGFAFGIGKRNGLMGPEEPTPDGGTDLMRRVEDTAVEMTIFMSIYRRNMYQAMMLMYTRVK